MADSDFRSAPYCSMIVLLLVELQELSWAPTAFRARDLRLIAQKVLARRASVHLERRVRCLNNPCEYLQGRFSEDSGQSATTAANTVIPRTALFRYSDRRCSDRKLGGRGCVPIISSNGR